MKCFQVKDILAFAILLQDVQFSKLLFWVWNLSWNLKNKYLWEKRSSLIKLHTDTETLWRKSVLSKSREMKNYKRVLKKNSSRLLLKHQKRFSSSSSFSFFSAKLYLEASSDRKEIQLLKKPTRSERKREKGAALTDIIS